MKLSLMMSVLLIGFAAHAEVGFKNGNERTAVLSEGQIVVDCRAGNPSIAYYTCRQEVMVQGEYDYFQGPEKVTADAVTLSAVHADGSRRSKDVGYNASTGKSTKSVNLWILTLFQKPLLDIGPNKVSYKMTKNGKVTGSGVFTANVIDGGRKVCHRRGYYYSPGPGNNDCRTPQNYCLQYFRENNFCL
jgi:hypothetical protein